MENLRRKIDAIYNRLFHDGGFSSPVADTMHGRETQLEDAIRKAIHELELTKSSFKSKQIMRIKEELVKVVEKKS